MSISSQRPAGEYQTQAEEMVNAATHAIGLVASIAAMAMLYKSHSGAAPLVLGSCIVYGITLILLYAASTAYHACRHDGIKSHLRKIDHASIYLLIAGTYTPFMLTFLRGPWGYSILVAVWLMAAIGVISKLFLNAGYSNVGTVAYVAMGWICLLALKPIIATFPPGAIVWMAAGGLLYTGGTIFFWLDHRKFFHSIWHLFVLGGSVCQFVAVLLYAANYPVGSSL